MLSDNRLNARVAYNDTGTFHKSQRLGPFWAHQEFSAGAEIPAIGWDWYLF